MEHKVNKVILGTRYNLRVEDFSDHHVLIVHCDRCGHEGVVPVATLRRAAQPHTRILDLSYKLKCRSCGRGNIGHWWTGEVV